MNRRSFFKSSVGGWLLATHSSSWVWFRSDKVRFGIVTDLHYAEVPNRGSRHCSLSGQKLASAIETFRRKNLDFLIELGDFKDQATPPDAKGTLNYLRVIESVLQSFGGPIYHVLGNHDMDSLSKEEFLATTQNAPSANGKAFYSFRTKGCTSIVLDANFNEDGSHYNRGNFDWTYASVPEQQLAWLKEELKRAEGPVFLFIHQLLDGFSAVPSSVCVNNWPQIVKILEESRKVAAVFQGHHHEGNYSLRHGIHYFTIPAMVEGGLEQNSYAVVEISLRDKSISIQGLGLMPSGIFAY